MTRYVRQLKVWREIVGQLGYVSLAALGQALHERVEREHDQRGIKGAEDAGEAVGAAVPMLWHAGDGNRDASQVCRADVVEEVLKSAGEAAAKEAA